MRLLLFMLLVVTGNSAAAQKNIQKRLQKKRALVEKQLATLNRMIAKTDKDIHISAQQRNQVQQQINSHRQQVTALNRQLSEIKDDLQQTDAGLGSLQQQLTDLKRSYAATLALSWKLMNGLHAMPVLYTSNANNTIQRGEYIKVLRQLQLDQVTEIRRLQQQYDQRKQTLGTAQQTTANRLQQNRHTATQLSAKEQSLTATQQQLASRKNKLQAMVNRQKKHQSAIEKRLRNLVATLSPKTPPVKTSNGHRPVNNPVVTSKATVKENSSFRLNRGRFNCPVNGYIYMHFGMVKIGEDGPVWDNSFLTLHTPSPGAPVMAVFEGEVASVSADENTFVIMIRHGDRYTVYGNLSAVTVTKGQTINTGTIIGRVAKGIDSDEGELEFGIYENNRFLNPGSWLNCH
jgi:murein hydrolase activator